MIPGTKNVTNVIPPRSSMRWPELSVEKMTRNRSGKANVNTAPAGLRQNAFCSNRSWRAAMARSLTGGRGLGGEGEVDVLQGGAGDGQPLEDGAVVAGP